MHETDRCFHNLEWPAAGARLAGPVAWLRGWVVGKPGHDFVDIRVRHAGRNHLGVLGLPRVDLAAHFKAPRPWLPAEFIVGVPVNVGAVTLTLEVQDSSGAWLALSQVALTIAPDGSPAPRVEGRIENSPDGTWTVRDAHHPFHGHLDDPGPAPRIRHGRVPVIGWLLDETRPLAGVLATTDTLVFNHLAHSRTDDSLARKVPQYPAARHARLRGEVDFPATVDTPACLRVYAVSTGGSVHLCFAQRIVPLPNEKARPQPGLHRYPAISHRALPVLPSGRPRRLLVVVRSLWPNDASLRALDLARHLTSSHRWAARVVSAEDGPLRRDFEATNVESLVVNPEPLFSAPNREAMEQAMAGLQRQIWWGHLDAVAVFDPVCGWAITLARKQQLPVVFDCSADEPLAPDPTAIPEVQALLRESWRAANVRCFTSQTAADAQAKLFGNLPAELIAQWHSPTLPAAPAPGTPLAALAPLRTVDCLRRHHPEIAARWTFRQGPAGLAEAEHLARSDDSLNQPTMSRAPDWSVDGVSLCLGPLFGRGPLRPLLDAAAAGIPVVAPRLPVTEEIFREARARLVDEANPVALAHDLLAYHALPESAQRAAAALAPLIRERHDPARLLPQWERLLATVAADRG